MAFRAPAGQVVGGNSERMRAVMRPITQIVVVGGGTAGWLAACLIAARADRDAATPIAVTLIESPEVATIGVGEGTWPTMRRTLATIGIDEAEFLLACDASFKQGSRFVGWRTGAADDAYLHPFTAPGDTEVDPHDLLRAWSQVGGDYAAAASPQARVCSADLAPRQRGMPAYAGAVNYAYHLDAAKFAELLRAHGTRRLGVRHRRDHVQSVVRGPEGDIAAVRLRDGAEVAGDLFIDCTGHAALLIGETLGVPFVDRADVLFNDRALALQVPVAPASAIASQTDATAHAGGWIWDIGLPKRRGIGCVYASAFTSDDQAAAALAAYVARVVPEADANAPPRRLAFRPGHRARFWERNCIAIGLAAGFLEPLEASAIVLVELSLQALLDDFPATRAGIAIRAERFNALFRYRWDRIVEFLKLHYLPSERDEPYWRAHRNPATVPPRLAELMTLWRERPPIAADFEGADEIFPAASHRYVLYGMGAPVPPAGAMRPVRGGGAARIAEVAQRGRALAASLPTNRAYLDALRAAADHPIPERMR